MNKKDVQDRIRDWIDRLNQLYQRVDDWREHLPDETQAETASIVQNTEGLMKEFRVKPRRIPSYAIRMGKEHVSFEPSALWVVGADGRVNITTKKHQYMLVDLRQSPSESSDWQLITPDINKIHVPFTESAFQKIVSNG